MTNEEKSIKIALNQNKRATELADVYACVFQGCLEMAEWKDKQFAEAIAPILIELDKLKQQVKSLLP